MFQIQQPSRYVRPMLVRNKTNRIYVELIDRLPDEGTALVESHHNMQRLPWVLSPGDGLTFEEDRYRLRIKGKPDPTIPGGSASAPTDIEIIITFLIPPSGGCPPSPGQILGSCTFKAYLYNNNVPLGSLP